MSREKLKALEELQAIDLQIRDLASAAEQHPARLRQIEGERSKAKAALDGLRGKLADNERARRQQQELLGLEREKVKKWESRLNELKTPREYAALARELDIAKKTNQGAELEIQRLAGEYETIKASSAEVEKALAEKDAVAAREGKEIEALLADVQRKMKTLEAARAEAVASCDKPLVNKYERIRKQRGGVAVVAVIAGTCKGCQMNIPPQMANNLRNNDEIQTCPSCHRFIYAAAEAASDEAPQGAN
ncbi:MAG TPA: C4-type zinc ribbon domain-containing protein [Myxococcales bacterium]|nr:C4-type zinc ribbon domain-containing protein [Myxococcales bacterium]